MRSLLKKAPFELKSLDLNDLVRETVEFLSSLAVGRKVELVSRITPEALPILGDRIQLQQVILNLVVNGIDAMRDMPSENRTITIRTSRVENFAAAIRVGSRTGHSRRQTKGGLRAVFHQQGGRHGHGAVHRAHHYRGAQWADIGKKSGSRRRVVPDQASACPIVGDPRHDACEYAPTSASGTSRHFVAIVARTHISRGGWLTSRPLPSSLPNWITEADIDFYVAEFERSGFRGGLNWYRNIDRNWELLAPWTGARVTVPALYIAGEQDLVVKFPGAEQLIANLVQFVPKLQKTIMLRDCGHWTQQEKPNEVNSAIIAFLKELTH